MLEPIQSMAGVSEAEPVFFRELRELCDERGIMLIFDEVQTGVGRTGNWFFAGSEAADGVEPDIITLAKSLGSGVPVGACLVNDQVSENIKITISARRSAAECSRWRRYSQRSKRSKHDGMIANAKAVENHLRESLDGRSGSRRLSRVKAVCSASNSTAHARPFMQSCLKTRIITGTSSDPNVLRLLPPLCVTTGRNRSCLVEVLCSYEQFS